MNLLTPDYVYAPHIPVGIIKQPDLDLMRASPIAGVAKVMCKPGLYTLLF